MECDMKRQFLQWGLALIFIAQAVPLLAQDVTFEASVNRTQVELGSVIMLTLTVEGDVQTAPVELPPMDGFDSRYVGPSSHISINGSQIYRRHSFMYNLYPQKTGTLVIPSIEEEFNGQTYRTESVEIEVVDAGKSVEKAGAQASLNDKIFVVLSVPKNEVYLNEGIPVNAKLFISALSVSNIHYPRMQGNGFELADYAPPDQYKQVIGGISYDVVQFSTTVYPERTGEVLLGPAGIKCTLLFKKNIDRTRSGPPASLFDDDFFESFFGAYDAREVMLESTDVTLNVKPLPEEGRPADFSGGVGQFDFDVTVSPNRVGVGDPITLRIRVSGDGNMDAVEMPVFEENEDFKVYEPEISEKGNMKILEQVVIPRHDRISSFPAIRFSYFDPREKQYKTITKGPTVLTVDALEEQETMRAVGLQDNLSVYSPPQETEQVGRDIRYIKDFPGSLNRRGRWIGDDPFLWFLFVVTLLGWGAAVAGHHHARRVATDPRFARHLRAPGQARRGLKRAGELINEKQIKEFYDTLYKTIVQYFADRFHIPPGAVYTASVKERTKAEGKPSDPEILNKLEIVIKQCESVCFAAEIPGTIRMREDLLKTREVIDYYQRRRR